MQETDMDLIMCISDIPFHKYKDLAFQSFAAFVFFVQCHSFAVETEGLSIGDSIDESVYTESSDIARLQMSSLCVVVKRDQQEIKSKEKST